MFTKDYWEGILIPWWQVLLLVLAVITVSAVTVIAITAVRKKRGETETRSTKDLTYGAICIAASFALSYVKIFSLPYGGSITAASTLPMLIYCYYFGFRKGLAVSTVYMLLQLIQGPYIVSPWSALLDYIVPYISLSSIGIFRFRRTRYDKAVSAGKPPLTCHSGFFIGTCVYMAIRLFSHVLAGVLFWADGIDFMGWSGDLSGAAAWGYSTTYNALFLVPDTAIAMAAAVFLLMSKAFNRFMASSSNALQYTDAGTKNDKGTAAGADER